MKVNIMTNKGIKETEVFELFTVCDMYWFCVTKSTESETTYVITEYLTGMKIVDLESFKHIEIAEDIILNILQNKYKSGKTGFQIHAENLGKLKHINKLYDWKVFYVNSDGFKCFDTFKTPDKEQAKFFCKQKHHVERIYQVRKVQ